MIILDSPNPRKIFKKLIKPKIPKAKAKFFNIEKKMLTVVVSDDTTTTRLLSNQTNNLFFLSVYSKELADFNEAMFNLLWEKSK
jgi:hypothetical protein